MSTLITGGSGFIGLALAEQRLRAGRRVVLFDRQPPPAALLASLPAEAIASGALHIRCGDIRDGQALQRLLGEHRCDEVVHGAAVTPDLQRERNDPASVVEVNLNGTLALVQACTTAPSLRRVLLLSSVAVYGFAPPPGPRYVEDQAWPQPLGLYGITKLAAEQMALRLAQLHGLDLRVARLGPVYGPWEYATGVRDMLSPHTQTLAAALAGQAASLPHALAADWLYSRDAAQALALLLDTPTLAHRLYNVGGEATTDLSQWCALLSRHCPAWQATLATEASLASVRYGLPGPRPALDTTRLHHCTGWRPQFSLASAATDYLQWHASVATP